VPAASILVIGTDASAAAELESVLAGAGYTVTIVGDPDAAFPQVPEHQLVILDVLPGERGAAAVCAEIRGTPSMASVPVLCVSGSDDVEERIRFLEAGADDVVARPFDGRELEARVEALLLRFQRSRDLTPVVSSDGVTMTHPRRLAAVFSPKGGVGTTTIAVNIAVAAAARRPGKVALVDLDLQFGAIATHLDIALKQTLADIARDDAALREPELLRSYAVKHDSGLHVFVAPATPELGETVTADAVARLLTTLVEAYDRVVIDAGSTLDERSLLVLDAADAIVLPVYPEMAALKAMHALLDYLAETGSVGAKATFVLNQMFSREILRMRDIESALGTRIEVQIPYDPFLYLKAVNEGVPLVVGAARSPGADSLIALSNAAFGEEATSAAPAAAPERRGGLLGGLRRRG
jgi:pilus assembly protein CpaE